MKCLTIWNPWAAAIVLGGKDVENRPWRAPAAFEGRRFFVHVGKQYQRDAVGPAGGWSGPAIHGLPLAEVRGAVIGSVELVGCTPAEDCQLDWCMRLPGGWAWLLKHPRVFRKPVPMRGALGLFEPTYRMGEGVPAALEAAEAEAMTPEAW